MPSTIQVKRIYEPVDSNDGIRLLVDRLWPRGVSKADAQLDEWLKELAPTDALRKQFHDGEYSWSGFKEAYWDELQALQAVESMQTLLHYIETTGAITLLYGSRNQKQNNAVALQMWLESNA